MEPDRPPDGHSILSSARTFFEAIPQGAQCLVVDGLQLLLLTRGAMLHLNPFSEHNVVLMPEDVGLLLASGTLARQSESSIPLSGNSRRAIYPNRQRR